MTRELTERGFSGAPALLGDIVRVGADGRRFTLAVVQAFVENQGDGWAWSLAQLSRIVEEGATPFGHDDDLVFAPYATFARTLGKRIGEMHAVLAQASDNPAFAPEPSSGGDVQAWRDHACAELERAVGVLGRQAALGAREARLAARLTREHEKLLDGMKQFAAGEVTAIKIRIHGDMHLGQVLVAGADAQIIDFEGEPRKSIDDRRAKASPLRDIAGMIRSFDYAAAKVARDRAAAAPEMEARAANLLQRFRNEATSALLAGYAVGAADALPRIDAELLDLFIIEKAAYEICYEIANRPDWLSVPLNGLAQLADRLLGGPNA
jgi:maltose alpha-D-glucosyltransferase/alpha-amylase